MEINRNVVVSYNDRSVLSDWDAEKQNNKIPPSKPTM